MTHRRLASLLVALCACGSIEEKPGGPGGDDGTTTGDASVNDAAPSPDACVVAGEETCNGRDDDCDMLIDEGFDGTGVACDGADTDRCAEGVTVCLGDGSGITCSDVTGDTAETCNGMDDDCDDAVDNGFDVGAACDGSDGDQCSDGVKTCNAGGSGIECSDPGPDIVDLCNGIDDDCDDATDEGFGVGDPCDGSDPDECVRGTRVCNSAGTGVVCEENMNTPEICDGLDNDCDGEFDEDGAGCIGNVCCNGTCCNLGEMCCGTVCEPMCN